MSAPDDSDAAESRTLSVGFKRNFPASESSSSGHKTPKKRRRSKRDRVDLQDVGDFVPKGTTFSNSDKIMSARSESSDVDDGQPHQPPSNAKGMNWNQGTQGKIRTSLRGGNQDFGQNRLATGFPEPPPKTADDGHQAELTRIASLVQSSTGESQDDAIEISDDTDTGEDSEGGMMINLEGQDNTSIPDSLSNTDEEMEDGEMLSSGLQTASPKSIEIVDDAHQQLQGDLQRSYRIDEERRVDKSNRRRLADLKPDELEKQIKYTLFNLNREQIDLNRHVICTACLEEGHMEDACPEKSCTHCGAQEDHSSRMCPQYRRCLKCRERGHDISVCASKLKETSVPCDYCGSDRHLENNCAMRFFPKPALTRNSQFKLWVSCCNCSSNDHLVGDCPATDPDQALRWSLKDLDPQQITNMSLESGSRRQANAAMNRGMRPEGLKIRGRAELHRVGDEGANPSSRDDPEPFLRAPVRQQKPAFGMQPSARSNDGGNRININVPRRSGDRYDPPTDSLGHGPRGHGNWYATDSFGDRRRSRSPEQGYDRGGYGNSYRPGPPPRHQTTAGGDYWQSQGPSGTRDSPRRRPENDSWRPPLPHEPLPNRLPSPQNGPQVHLPTRKGSNPWLNSQAQQESMTAAHFQPKQPQRLQQQQQHHHQQRMSGTENKGKNNAGNQGKAKEAHASGKKKRRTKQQIEQFKGGSAPDHVANQGRRDGAKAGRQGP